MGAWGFGFAFAFVFWRSSGFLGPKLGRNEARLAGSASLHLADGVGFPSSETALGWQGLGTALLHHRVREPEHFRDPGLSYSNFQ